MRVVIVEQQHRLRRDLILVGLLVFFGLVTVAVLLLPSLL